MNLPLLIEPVQEAPEAVDTYISPSRLNLWLRCPLAWRLRYLEGIVPPTTPSLFLGRVVHRGLELWYRHRQLGVWLDPPVVVREVEQVWEEMVAQEHVEFESSQAESVLRAQAGGLLEAYIAQVPVDEPLPIAVEVPLRWPLVDAETGEDLGIPLVGILDLVLGGPAGARVIDFKTAARSSEALEILHEIQLTSYAWLLRQETGQVESGLEIRSLIKTKQPKIEVHRYPARSERHFRRLFAVVRAYLEDLDHGRLVYRPGFHCGMCDYAGGACREWRP